MKETPKDISLLLAPPKPLEVKKHEEMIANEVEAMEVIYEEREERLERVQGRALEWQTNYFCRGIILEVVETSIVEAEWRQQACMELVMDVMEGAVKESRQRMCKQIIMESVVCSSWQSL